LDEPLERHMSKALPTVGSGEPVSTAMAELEGATALLVLDDGKPIGILTRSDLLGFLAGGAR
ncbi:MAG TPA: CBS domain-containing protein, partial [Mycobacteriales bacterium]|nr:CBS domain-containing protein [Mycobacteriales bacterium]